MKRREKRKMEKRMKRRQIRMHGRRIRKEEDKNAEAEKN